MPKSMKQRVAELTPRLREVVRLTSLGCNMAEMGAILGLSAYTVDNHRCRAMRILGVSKTAMLTRVAIIYRISSLRDELTRAERRKLASL